MAFSVLDLIFPPRSLLGVEGDWVSEEEAAELQPHPFALSHDRLTAMGLPSLDRLIAMDRYQASPLLRRAIHTWKYRGVRSLEKTLSAFLCDGMRKFDISSQAVLCPIPLFWARSFDRGFNQSHVLAAALSCERRMSLRQVLLRTASTGHQAHRTGAERRAAMGQVFTVREVPPAHVVLIDDVCTTGSTLESAACALRENGARYVEAIVLALD